MPLSQDRCRSRFHYFVQGEAIKRGMKGWVRNTDEKDMSRLKIEGADGKWLIS
ncbi:acylphosphatase [Bacillus sp. SL00103]